MVRGLEVRTTDRKDAALLERGRGGQRRLLARRMALSVGQREPDRGPDSRSLGQRPADDQSGQKIRLGRTGDPRRDGCDVKGETPSQKGQDGKSTDRGGGDDRLNEALVVIGHFTEPHGAGKNQTSYEARHDVDEVRPVRRDSGMRSGMPISRVIGRAAERSRPSDCRRSRPNARRSISPVSMARAERVGDRPRWPVRGGCQAAGASGSGP